MALDDDEFLLKIKLISNEDFTVPVRLNMSVGSLRANIEEKLQSQQQIRMIFSGRVLDDDTKSLKDVKITPASVLHIVQQQQRNDNDNAQSDHTNTNTTRSANSGERTNNYANTSSAGGVPLPPGMRTFMTPGGMASIGVYSSSDGSTLNPENMNGSIQGLLSGLLNQTFGGQGQRQQQTQSSPEIVPVHSETPTSAPASSPAPASVPVSIQASVPEAPTISPAMVGSSAAPMSFDFPIGNTVHPTERNRLSIRGRHQFQELVESALGIMRLACSMLPENVPLPPLTDLTSLNIREPLDILSKLLCDLMAYMTAIRLPINQLANRFRETDSLSESSIARRVEMGVEMKKLSSMLYGLSQASSTIANAIDSVQFGPAPHGFPGAMGAPQGLSMNTQMQAPQTRGSMPYMNQFGPNGSNVNIPQGVQGNPLSQPTPAFQFGRTDPIPTGPFTPAPTSVSMQGLAVPQQAASSQNEDQSHPKETSFGTARRKVKTKKTYSNSSKKGV